MKQIMSFEYQMVYETLAQTFSLYIYPQYVQLRMHDGGHQISL